MNNLELTFCLSNNKFTKLYFAGVFSADRLYNLVNLKPPYFVIVNTEPIYKKFGHWYCILVGYNIIEIFDSSGKLFLKNKYLYEFIKTINLTKKYKIKSNQIEFQNPNSSVCGLYSSMFAFYRCKGQKFETFCRKFNKNKKIDNDKKVKILFKKEFKNCIKKIDCNTSQSSISPLYLCKLYQKNYK